jgi:hypothetical protein
MDELRSLENSAKAAEAISSRPHDLCSGRRGKSLETESSHRIIATSSPVLLSADSIVRYDAQ